jgi:hypothetical protein
MEEKVKMIVNEEGNIMGKGYRRELMGGGNYTATKIIFIIPIKGMARPQSQFLHSCVCERYMYSQYLSTYLAAEK